MKVGEGIQFPAETDPNEVGIPRNSPHAGRGIGETPPPPNGAGRGGVERGRGILFLPPRCGESPWVVAFPTKFP